MIFSDPMSFEAFLGKSKCICLTATPDDGEEALENTVLKYLNFQVIGDKDVKELTIDQTLEKERFSGYIRE